MPSVRDVTSGKVDRNPNARVAAGRPVGGVQAPTSRQGMTGTRRRAWCDGPLVQSASARRAFLVGGWELPGELVACPSPASRDDQSQCLSTREEGRRRAEGYVSRDDLPACQWLN